MVKCISNCFPLSEMDIQFIVTLGNMILYWHCLFYFIDYIEDWWWTLFVSYHLWQPFTGVLKMHFRFGLRIFKAASNLRSKWSPMFPLLARIWDIRLSLLITFLWQGWRESLAKEYTGTYKQTVSELCFPAFNSSTAHWTGLTRGRIPYLTGGNLRGFFYFYFK